MFDSPSAVNVVQEDGIQFFAAFLPVLENLGAFCNFCIKEIFLKTCSYNGLIQEQ